MSYIQTRNKTSLCVKQWGEGRPVVLIHGWPLSSDSWDPQAYALAYVGAPHGLFVTHQDRLMKYLLAFLKN